MQIKEVEVTTGLTKKAIRYYEECGLIKISKKENGYKEYSDENVNTLLLIRKYRLLDFSVDDIRKYMNYEDCRVVIGVKLGQNEEKILQAHQVKQILEKMLDGERIENIDIEKNLLEEKKRGYMYIKNNNTLVGIMNLIVFISIYSFVFMNHIKDTSWYITAILGGLAAMLLRIEEKRKKRANSFGILLLERKPVEVLIQLSVSTFIYIVASVMLYNGIYYAKMFYFEWNGDWFEIIGNIILGAAFAIASIIALVLSFCNPNKKDTEYI